MKKYSDLIEAATNVLTEGAVSAIDILMPRTCITCGRKLESNEKYLCIYCEADLPLTHFWERTCNPMADKLNLLIQKKLDSIELSRDTLADSSTEEPEPGTSPAVKYSHASALFFYHGDAGYKKIPQRLKYLADTEEGRHYAGLLGKLMRDSSDFQDIDLIIPVPLHWFRKWGRGYNQAEIIARALAKELGAQVRTDLLARTRYTKTQTKLDVEAKAKNVSNAFSMKRRNMDLGSVRHVLVTDDVFTTGATICSCISVLQDFFGNEVRISAATLGFVSQG